MVGVLGCWSASCGAPDAQKKEKEEMSVKKYDPGAKKERSKNNINDRRMNESVNEVKNPGRLHKAVFQQSIKALIQKITL